MNDIKCMFIKEFLQVTSNRKLVISTFGITLLSLICAFKCNNSLLPMEYLRNILPICVSFISCNMIMQTIIIDEINYKTLDILIVSRLSKLSIILGKALLGVAFGMGTTFISLILLYIASFFSPYLEGVRVITLFNIIASFEVALLSSLISISLALILRNIQIMNAFNMAIMLGTIFLFYYFTFKLSLSMAVVVIGIMVLCILLTCLSVSLISIKNYTISK